MISIITEPGVFLIGTQAVFDGELQRYLDAVGAPGWRSDAPSAGEKIIETSSRLCYDSYKKPRPGGNKAHVDHILEALHGSVCEHGVFTVIITGISRRCCEQLTRHRTLSPSQRSQRFVDESSTAFVLPPAYKKSLAAWKFAERLREAHAGTIFQDWHQIMVEAAEFFRKTITPEMVYQHAETADAWIAASEYSLTMYKRLIKTSTETGLFDFVTDKTLRRKRIMEAARSKLTNDVETRIAVTANYRAWRWFVERRGSTDVDLETRRLDAALAVKFKEAAPNAFGDVEVYTADDDFPAVRVKHHKV